MPESAGSLRDRAYLALLLLVGAGALGSGIFQVLVEGNAGPIAVFDTVLGVAVLLVTWLFLAPLAVPSFFGDLPVGAGPLIRPYLPIPVTSAVGFGATGPGSRNRRSVGPSARGDAFPEPEIPRWADSMVPHAVASDGIPPAKSPRTPAREPPLDEIVEEDPVADDRLPRFLSDEPEEVAAPSAPDDPHDVVRELDLISAEIEHSPRKRPILPGESPPFGAAGAV
ncbi:MAG: hypothetical protein L3K19_04605 [Thermoplasmata archaeon]|nr:hypothetical protein [Thermoplasmata archaeon]